MTVLKLNPAQYADWFDRSAADFPLVMQQAATSGAMATVPVLVKATNSSPAPSGQGNAGAVDTGRYRRAWRASKHPNGAWVYNDLPYAPVIEHGRTKGRRPPPYRELVAWCRRKAKAQNPEAMARALASAIGKRGIKARKVMAGAQSDMNRAFRKEVIRVLDRWSKARR